MTVAMMGTWAPAHLVQIARDRLGLAAFLRAEPRPRSLRVDECKNGNVEFLGELHQPEGLSISLRMGHAEVPLQLLFRVAPTLVPNHHHRIIVEARPAADDRRVITESAIAVQLDEVGERQTDVVSGERTLRVARDLDSLKGREIPVDLFTQIGELSLEGLYGFGNAELAVARGFLDLVDLPFQLGDRLLELQLCC